jgi:hypothetical protein
VSGIPILSVDTDEIVTVDGDLVINSDIYSGLTAGATHLINSVSYSLYNAAFYDYWVKSDTPTNMRSGTVMVVWSGASSSVEFTDTSTSDIGDTSQVSFDLNISGGNLELSSIISTGSFATWSIKTGNRFI